MKIEEAFNLLIMAVEQEDQPVKDFLESKKVEQEQARRLIFFTQIAWGREILRDYNLVFSPDYCCFDQHGEIVRSGKLDEESHFSYAQSQIQKYQGSVVFEKLACTSSEHNALMASLRDGANPRNLIFTPACF